MAINTLMGLLAANGHSQESLLPAAPKAHASSPYGGAASTSRRMSAFTASDLGINTLLFQNGDILRSRSREVIRQNPWASNGLEKWVSNAVGIGIKPRWKNIDSALKKTIQTKFLRWTDEADADGLTDFFGLQALCYREMIEAGEVFIRVRYRRPENGLSVPVQFQIIESEQVPYFSTLQAAGPQNTVRMGIERNAWGQRVAYHMYKSHPGDLTNLGSGGSEIVRVPADQVLHLFRPIRAGQERGEPWLAKVLARLYDLHRFEDAYLMQQLVATLFTGFFRVGTADEGLGGEEPSGDSGDISNMKLEPGTLIKLLPGQEPPTFTKPPDSNDLEPFMRQGLRGVSAGMGNTYEQTTGDMTGVNFSSARVAVLEFRRHCQTLQQHVINFQFCRPIGKIWLDQAVLSGALKLPGYEKDPTPYRDIEWQPPKWDWVDPLKDVQAVKEELDACLTSREAVVAERGDDIEDIDDAIARDHERERRLGLKPVYGTAATARDGNQPSDGPVGEGVKDGAVAKKAPSGMVTNGTNGVSR